ncbi:phosphotransferase family protein [Lacisediminimonas profundi]|uniref:phosphotransferase family protein n=1 Tax=Lacisediminimonas profundi TaxID=2603856 RepID=UPI00124BC1A2|nr:phosphotransferase family protein [Lacisediminimonas profundi]
MNEALFHPPAQQIAQDWDALAAHLAAQGMALDLSSPPRQFAGGFGNLNYLVRIDGADWVLRRPPPGDRVPGGNDMVREFGITSKLWRGFPLAPRAIHCCMDEAVLGAPFLIMEYRPGLVIGGQLPADRALSLAERATIGNTLVQTLAQLHAVDARAVGLDKLGKPDGMLARMVEGWEKRANVAYGADTPAGIARTAAWLRQRLPAQQQGPTLLHSDFKLDNVILDPVTLAPCAVIDWDMSTRGDPLVDLATLLSYWSEAGDPPVMQQLNQMPTAEPGFPTRAEVAAMYARQTGRDLSGFGFYRVLCLFKLTVVFMQLHARYRRGEMVNERYRSFGPLAAGLLDFTEASASVNFD